MVRRMLKDEKGAVLSFSLVFLVPFATVIFFSGRLLENIVVFLIALPMVFYPLFFLLRGVHITRKEWSRGTVYIYRTNPVSSLENETAYLVYFTLESLLFTIIPVVLVHILSHDFKTFVVFTLSWGTFFVYLPLFVLAFLSGRFLYLLSRSIYRNRVIIILSAGIAEVVLFLKLYSVFDDFIPAPFKLKVITSSVHVYNIGAFSFVYSSAWLFIMFLLNLYFWKISEG